VALTNKAAACCAVLPPAACCCGPRLRTRGLHGLMCGVQVSAMPSAAYVATLEGMLRQCQAELGDVNKQCVLRAEAYFDLSPTHLT
jgi:hypothetical protein